MPPGPVGITPDESAATIFENCIFENKASILASLVEIDGKPSKDLPTTLYMKDCQMNDVARGITVNLRNWADNRTLASRIQAAECLHNRKR